MFVDPETNCGVFEL